MRAVLDIFLLGISSFADDVSRSALGFHIDLAYIFTKNTQRNHLYAADKAQNACSRCPPGDCSSGKFGNQSVNDADKTKKSDKNSKTGDISDWLYT